MKAARITERKKKYSQVRIGFILSGREDEVSAIYCKPYEGERLKLQISEFEFEEFHIEDVPRDLAEKVFRMAEIDLDREIDSLDFDLADLKCKKKKMAVILKDIYK